VASARPDAIVHELTAIGSVDPRHFDRDFALTNRLRIEGTDHLLSAGQAVGVGRFVVQSYGAWWYERTGGPVKNEEDPLDTTPAREMRDSRAAIRHLEQAVLAARWTEGIVLRYGGFYGPGTSMAPGGELPEMIRRLPALAQEVGAKKPMRVPRFIGRLFAGEVGVVMMTDARGASNAKAKRELGWRPARPSWRQGFLAA
jgi:nucleoside-diphosphate-sugar epimerase